MRGQETDRVGQGAQKKCGNRDNNTWMTAYPVPDGMSLEWSLVEQSKPGARQGACFGGVLPFFVDEDKVAAVRWCWKSMELSVAALLISNEHLIEKTPLTVLTAIAAALSRV